MIVKIIEREFGINFYMKNKQSNTNNAEVLSNFFWRLAERGAAQGGSLIVSIVLARLLDPDVYGTVALITVITTILQVFVDSGMGNALIQKKDADDLDFSSVFYFNMITCIILYVGIFFATPLIADFYGIDELAPLIRVLSLTIVVSGLKNVQQAYVSREMQFKRFFFATLGGTVFSAFVGILMAYQGMGAWALAGQYLSNLMIDTLVLWITVKWHPKKMFSIKRLKDLFSFGWKLLISSLIDTVYNNVRQLIIGKLYNSSELAYYNQGQKIPNIIVNNVNTSIDSVLLPTMSQQQEHAECVKSMTRRAIKTSTYVMAPLLMGIAFCGEPLVKLLLTDKWLPCVPYMQIFCITFMFYPIHTANLNAIKAMGRSDLFLKLEIIKKVIGLTILLTSMWFGVMAIAYSLLLGSVLSQIINTWPNKKLLKYGYLEQLKDIMPGIALAVIMGIGVYFFKYLPLPTIIILVIQFFTGAEFYIGVSALFKFESFEYIRNTIKTKKRKRTRGE